MRSQHPVQLTLVRHSEAYKNLEDRHGGGKQQLTAKGMAQAYNLGEALTGEVTTIIHQPEERTRQTALLMGYTALCEVIKEDRLQALDIGKITGLSDNEILEHYPDVAASLGAWKKHEAPLTLPPHLEIEPLDIFARRIQDGLDSHINQTREHERLVFVGTTSTLTMARHLITHDGFTPDDYTFHVPPLGTMETWTLSTESPVHTGNIR